MVGVLIVIAEILSWPGCLTDYELWNACEEFLWAISATILLFGILLRAITCLTAYIRKWRQQSNRDKMSWSEFAKDFKASHHIKKKVFI